MGKIVISAKRKVISKKQKPYKTELTLEAFGDTIKEWNPREYIINPENVGKGIMECLMNNDPKGVMEVISIYLEAINKSKATKAVGLHRQTMYSALKHKNPTIKTLAKLMHAYAR